VRAQAAPRASMSYEMRAGVIVVTPRGTPADGERLAMYEAIKQDTSVPKSVPVLLDWSRMDNTSAGDIERRVRLFIARLGPKLGQVCAIIVPPRLAVEGRQLQRTASAHGLRVAPFRDEASALRWMI
jgi:hypothetical protein